MDKNDQQQPPLPKNGTDQILGFFLEKTGIRGRLVRLGSAVDSILARHNYPDTVAALLGETLALATTLAFAIKLGGLFTLQTRGDGPVNLLVADVTKEGHLRGYAQYDAEKVKLAGVGSALLLGKGHMAFTIDQGPETDRYQGIVELIGRDMAEMAQNYFLKSEQLETTFKVFVGKNEQGQWASSALMIQRIPEGGGYAANNNSPIGGPTPEEQQENWARCRILMNTITEKEMRDTDLPSEILLNRLFHEEGLVIGETQNLFDQCRCSRQRVAMVLSTIPESEIPELMENGKVEVKCEFCSASYDFDAEQIRQITPGPGVRG